MISTSKLISLVLAGAALPTAVLGGNMIAVNNCDFDVWCWAAKNDGTTAPEVPVPGRGGMYQSPLPAADDNVGSVLKCSMSADYSQPYQMELAVQDGRSWFDLSAIDGNSFLPFMRHADIAGQCVLHCDPGSNACEYPVQVDCPTQADAWLSLC
ncbi:Protein SLG1 [Hypoxylon texense]